MADKETKCTVCEKIVLWKDVLTTIAPMSDGKTGKEAFFPFCGWDCLANFSTKRKRVISLSDDADAEAFDVKMDLLDQYREACILTSTLDRLYVQTEHVTQDSKFTTPIYNEFCNAREEQFKVRDKILDRWRLI